MQVRGKSAVLIGAEGNSPPLSFITVSDAQGLALIGLGVAEAVFVDPAAAEPVPVVAAPEAAPAPADAPAPVAETSPAPIETPATEEPDNGGQEGETREDSIAAAIDLVEDGDLVKTGARAGRPKVSAIEAITGLKDVTVEEIDAAVAARDA